jgi:hypothetical protein
MTEDSGIDDSGGSTNQPIVSQYSPVQLDISSPHSSTSFTQGARSHSLTSSDCSLQLKFGELMTTDGQLGVLFFFLNGRFYGIFFLHQNLMTGYQTLNLFCSKTHF